MEVCGALGAQIKVRVSLPNKGLRSTGQGPENLQTKCTGVRSWPAGCIYRWDGGAGGKRRGDVRTQGTAVEEV